MTFQLQIWRGKEYEPSVENTDPEYCRSTAEGMHLKAWRIVKLEKCRPDKPKYTRPRNSPTKGRTTKYTAATVAGAYFAWAKAKGLTSVAVYDDVRLTYNGPKPTHWQGIELRYVNAADFLGDAPAPEEDEQS